MAARYVVDTNLLVYALDRREPEKHERAREVLRRVGGAGTAALPAQVLSEYSNACLKKLEPRPDPEYLSPTRLTPRSTSLPCARSG